MMAFKIVNCLIVDQLAIVNYTWCSYILKNTFHMGYPFQYCVIQNIGAHVQCNLIFWKLCHPQWGLINYYPYLQTLYWFIHLKIMNILFYTSSMRGLHPTGVLVFNNIISGCSYHPQCGRTNTHSTGVFISDFEYHIPLGLVILIYYPLVVPYGEKSYLGIHFQY